MATKHNQKIGKEGELIAVAFLQGQGHQILECNWKFKQFEIDIISKSKDIIVFTEVKTRTSREFGKPEQAVGLSKQRQLGKAADEYMHQKNYDGDIRFDIMSISLPKNEDYEILYLEDAFFPMG